MKYAITKPTPNTKQIMVKIFVVDIVGGPFVSQGEQIGEIQLVVAGLNMTDDDLLKRRAMEFLHGVVQEANPDSKLGELKL